MSPLLDVITTVGNESTPVSLNTGSLRKSSVKIPRSGPRIPNVYGTGEADITGPVKIQIKREIAAIKMCNTQVPGQVGSAPSCQGSSAITHHYPCVISPMRVPPLPQSTDVLLSQAVQALSLGPFSAQTRLRTHRHLSRLHTEQSEGNCRKLTSSCSGLPDNSGNSVAESAPQQCGACGLEFTSLTILTQHLTRHVYDGLYAAQWLTQAMGLVLPSQTTIESVPTIQDDHESGFLPCSSPD